jgi:signal transduction histidine kinase
MLTAETDLSVRNVALGMGAMDYLSKPVDPNELTARLRNALRLKSYQDELLEQKERLQEQLEQVQRLELAGLIAVQAVHDLKNAMTGILGSAEVIMAKEVPDLARRGAERITASAKYAADITGHILRAARGDSGEGREEPVTDLNHAIEDCVEMIRAGVPHGVQIRWLPPGEPVRVAVPRTAVMQVVMNLLTNSLQALGERGLIELKAAPSSDNTVSLVVRDDGPGMDESMAAEAFEAFVTTKGPGEGTGLGLATVKRIIERYGGTIDLTTAPGAGAAFNLRLRRAASPAEESEPAKV